MLKRVVMMGLASISVVLMLGADAKAQSLWDVQWWWGSIDCRSLLNALGKKAAPSTLVECLAAIEQFSWACRNKGGNADASGSHIFAPQTQPVLKTSLQATGCTLDKVTGKWVCNESITDEQLDAALLQLLGDPAVLCPNRNFSLTLDLVTQMCARVNVKSCHVPGTTTACDPRVTQNCVCDILQDTVDAECSLPAGSPSGTQYSCSSTTCTNLP